MIILIELITSFTTFVTSLVTSLHLVKCNSSPIALPVDIRPILGLLLLQNGTTLNGSSTAGPLADIIGLGLKGLCYSLKYYRNGIWL
jgi:hypothetical protein